MSPLRPVPATRSTRARRAGASAALLVLLSLVLAPTGCLAPPAAPSPRWFRPPLPAAQAEASPTPGGRAAALRLRQPEAASRLGDRIALRTSDVEFGRHELLRWTDEPAVYLRLVLEAALYGGGRLERSQRASSPVLETRLVAFDDVRDGDARRADVVVDARLVTADGRTLLSRLYERTRPVAGHGPETLVRELGVALQEITEQLAGDVAVALAEAEAVAGGAPG